MCCGANRFDFAMSDTRRETVSAEEKIVFAFDGTNVSGKEMCVKKLKTKMFPKKL